MKRRARHLRADCNFNSTHVTHLGIRRRSSVDCCDWSIERSRAPVEKYWGWGRGGGRHEKVRVSLPKPNLVLGNLIERRRPRI